MVELYFPFPVHADIGHEEYDREVAGWLSQHSDLPQSQRDAMIASRVPALMAFTVSQVRPEMLRLASTWIAVSLLVDDVLEAASIEEVAVMAGCGSRIWEDPTAPAQDTPITRMVRQNAQEVLALATPMQRHRLRAAHQQYFAAIVTEHLLDAAPQPPAVEVHAMVREAASGLAVLSAVVEFANGMDIPEEEYYSPPVRAFAQAAHLALAWVNDVGAFPKDVLEGHQNNLVAVLAARLGCSTREAIDEAVAVINSAHYAMDELSRMLLQESSPALRGYIRSMLRKYGAFVSWQLNSTRYAGVLAEEPLTITRTAPAGAHVPPDITSIAWWWDHLPVQSAA